MDARYCEGFTQVLVFLRGMWDGKYFKVTVHKKI